MFYQELSLDKDIAKKIYLSVMNGGTKMFKDHDGQNKVMLSSFKKEIDYIHNRLSIVYKDEYEHLKNIKKYNVKGSLMNHLLCDIENQILMFVYDEIGKPENIVLCFDGLMIPSDIYDGISLKEINDKIKIKFGADIQLMDKPMNNALSVPHNYTSIMAKTIQCRKIMIDAITNCRVSIKDYSLMFVELFYDIVIISTNITGGYVWNDAIKLWSYNDDVLAIASMGSDELTNLVDNNLRQYYSNLADGNVKQFNTYNKMLCKYSIMFNTPQIMREMFSLASTKLRKDNGYSTFNLTHNLLPLLNGNIIDLQTLNVRPRTKDDLFTFECPVEYLSITDDDIKHLFEYIGPIFCYDQEYIDYKQIILGSYLCGNIYSRNFSVFHGAGRNGKSAIIKSLTTILTDNLSSSIAKHIIVKGKNTVELHNQSHTSSLMPILAKRFVYTEELNKDDILISDMIKKISSGDPISGAREVYGRKTITIHPFCKLVISSNYIPSYNFQDVAIIDRMIIDPHKARFLTPDKLLVEKSNGNYRPDIYNYYPVNNNIVQQYSCKSHQLNVLFTWLANGCSKYYNIRENIPVPKIISAYMDDHLMELDIVKKWLFECCVIVPPSYFNENPDKNKSQGTVFIMVEK
jgi:phage/plasmid-associated DNA primase